MVCFKPISTIKITLLFIYFISTMNYSILGMNKLLINTAKLKNHIIYCYVEQCLLAFSLNQANSYFTLAFVLRMYHIALPYMVLLICRFFSSENGANSLNFSRITLLTLYLRHLSFGIRLVW